jgi:release factor glutamine methyltransferase
MQTTFHGFPFETEPGLVFTPRPASERLVDVALERIGSRPARVADVGTGSGVIAIAIARLAPQVEVWASDVCANALRLAHENAADVHARVHFLKADLLEGMPFDLDLIVANLPYLPPSTTGYNDEPARAVFPTGDGFDHYRRLLASAADHLNGDGGIVIQVPDAVLEAERSELPWLRSRLEALVAQAA